MSETKKSILVYMALLVGVGVIIFAVIRVGNKLQAPASIGGYWKIQLSDQEFAVCAALSDISTPLTLEIQQSGPHLQMTLPLDTRNISLDGRIDGIAFEARANDDDRLILRGALDRGSQPNLVSATLAGEDCLKPVFFMATRLENRLTSDGGH